VAVSGHISLPHRSVAPPPVLEVLVADVVLALVVATDEVTSPLPVVVETPEVTEMPEFTDVMVAPLVVAPLWPPLPVDPALLLKSASESPTPPQPMAIAMAPPSAPSEIR
jgi:hypothetical protein